METKLYQPASLETAACLWEAVMDMRPTHPDIAVAFERLGTSHLRLTVIGWTDAADADWATVREKCWDKPFDWEWIPEWIAENVIWTEHMPTLQSPRTVPGGLR